MGRFCRGRPTSDVETGARTGSHDVFARAFEAMIDYIPSQLAGTDLVADIGNSDFRTLAPLTHIAD